MGCKKLWRKNRALISDWQQLYDAVETLFGGNLAKSKATHTASVMEICGLVKLVGNRSSSPDLSIERILRLLFGFHLSLS